MGNSTQDRLSHLDESGNARMIDVGDKPVTVRRATAEGFIRISPALEQAIRDDSLRKGDALAVGRLAGLLAAKRTHELIPLCHNLPLDDVQVEADLLPGRVRITASVRATARTGVEMEALTAVTVAALTVLDMGKSIDRGMVIEGVRVLEKRGGRSGDYTAPPRDGRGDPP